MIDNIPLYTALILGVLINIACFLVGGYAGFIVSIGSFKRILDDVGLLDEFEKRIERRLELKGDK